jgi:hypothetical protein
MYQEILEEFFEKNISSEISDEIKTAKEQNLSLPPDQFHFQINHFLNLVQENIEGFLHTAKINPENTKECDKFLTLFKYKDNSQIELLTELFYNAYFLIEFNECLEKSKARIIFNFGKDMAIFENETLPRIKSLRDDLLKKHTALQTTINDKFAHFIEELELEVNLINEYLSPYNSLKVSGLSVSGSLFPSNQGRPSNPFFEIALLSVNEVADKISPKTKYAEVVIPAMLYFAEKFPNSIDKNDFNNADKVRNRIKYIKETINDKAYFQSPPTGEY